ncbi:O-antigen ligase family protein [Maribacter aestuarii]|uniref:O-antigen ligase family protein n=1 Tax=Maribacter aestuarii TaxID=1130723 RepID=UPI00248AE29A|nr:O-antigen ligase family protein [Maribacter aestuarii]
MPIKEYSLFEQIDYFISKGFYWISGSSIRGYRLANVEIKLFVHHNYVASYFVVAFYAALNIIIYAKNMVLKFLMFVPALIFLGFVFYLPSKMNQLIILAAIPIFIYHSFGKRTAIYLTIVGLIASCFLLYKEREKVSTIKLIEKENLISKETAIIDFYRYHVYSCSVNKIPDNYLFGMGKGDVQSYLNSCLPSDEWPGLSEVRREYNTHSQLLNYLISGGIIGLFLFIGLWAKLFSLASRQNLSRLLILLLVIFANTIFENYLSRLWGCFIFVFFTFIYLQTDLNRLILKKNKDN